MTLDDYPHIGRGWAFPVRWRDDGGVLRVETAAGEAKIRQSMEVILKTGIGERAMRPTFGAGVHRFVFAPRLDATIHEIGFDTARVLRRWEQRAIVDSVDAEIAGTNDRIDITVEYRIDRHRRPNNLVLPFYRMGEEQ